MAKSRKPLELEEYNTQFVTVYGTDENPYHETGKPFEIHPDMAAHLEKKGFVTFGAPGETLEEGEEL